MSAALTGRSLANNSVDTGMKRLARQVLGALGKPKPTRSLDDFSRIAIRYGTDKFGSHLYTPIYHDLFAPIRHAKRRILEIGVGGYGSALAGGAGLCALADYFPAATIVGLDLEEKRLPPHPRIAIMRGSQDDIAVLDELWAQHGPFDIIIDDGSHLPGHVLTTFRHLYPMMPATGIYVVEDTQTSLWPDLGGRSDGTASIFEQAHQVGLAMHASEAIAGGGTPIYTAFDSITKAVRTYRNLVVFERGNNEYPSNNKFDFDHAEVVRVREAIAQEQLTNPSAGAYLTQIDMAVWGGRTNEAVALAREVVRFYPTDQRALAYVYGVLMRLGFTDECRAVAEALVKVLPSDPEAQYRADHHRYCGAAEFA